MRPQHKKSSNVTYLVALSLLGLYNVALIILALHQHDGLNLLLYSLVPDMFSVYLGLHGFHQNQFNDRHVEHHLRTIEGYIETILGLDDKERFNL